MRRDNSLAKRWAIPGGVIALSAALAVVLLVVLPAVYSPQSARAQMGGPGGGPSAASPMPMGPGGAGAPGGMPGPGMGMPGMGGMGGMGGPGAMGPGMGMGMGVERPAAPAQPAAPTEVVEPLEPYRENPFLPLEAAGRRERMPWVRSYGWSMSRFPIAMAASMPRPSRPEPKAPPPPPPPAEKFLRVSSIAWTGGQAMATYETPDGKTGVVKPGEFVGEWQVVEILRDRIKVKHRKSGEVQEVFLRPREKMPEAPKRAQPGAMPGMPGGMPMPGPGAMGPGAQAPGGPARMPAPGSLLRPGGFRGGPGGPAAMPEPGTMPAPGMMGGPQQPGAGGAPRLRGGFGRPSFQPPGGRGRGR